MDPSIADDQRKGIASTWTAQEYGSELRQASHLGLFKQMLATSAAAAGFGGDEKEGEGGGGGGEVPPYNT